MDCKDLIGIYSTGPWAELVKFRTKSNDMASIAWLPSSAALVVVDSHLCYKFLVYSTSGEVDFVILIAALTSIKFSFF